MVLRIKIKFMDRSRPFLCFPSKTTFPFLITLLSNFSCYLYNFILVTNENLRVGILSFLYRSVPLKNQPELRSCNLYLVPCLILHFFWSVLSSIFFLLWISSFKSSKYLVCSWMLLSFFPESGLLKQVHVHFLFFNKYKHSTMP